MIDYSEIDLEDMAAKMQQYNDVIRGQTRAYAERMNKELHGAWRAGYDYVHVYDKMGTLARPDLDGMYALTQYVLPANHERPPDPPGLTYRHTYDLTCVPDHVIRAATRGEIADYRTPDYNPE